MAGICKRANYSLQNKTNLDQALTWIDQAVAQNNSFAPLKIKADILQQMGRTTEADKIINDALVDANEGELNTYGYQLINEGKVDRAIAVLTSNTERHPKSANTWDSLGEAYATKGDKKNAITSFKKSLSLNPNPATRANSEKFMKQLSPK